ncbi:DUF6912 family protein [Nocardioides sp. Root151]|uniref:DUF6912 family protein n=1 Tax=Nocardioides sp. Root151 TaxID=1736475 RepID=UPI000702A442|nr:hypothetical protein [Nocardioides sp. Root151]KQZ75224.1 hypothetical protein ASD66_02295 [Nocardioides sp. Root151]
MSTRVYLPLTAERLAALVADARLPGPLDAHAVTEGLRDSWPDGDDEGWEYAALSAAADESWSLRGVGARRIVVAADVGSVESRGMEGEPTAVRVTGDLTWKHVAAAHVDVDDQTDATVEGSELAWFATQEIADLA